MHFSQFQSNPYPPPPTHTDLAPLPSATSPRRAAPAPCPAAPRGRGLVVCLTSRRRPTLIGAHVAGNGADRARQTVEGRRGQCEKRWRVGEDSEDSARQTVEGKTETTGPARNRWRVGQRRTGSTIDAWFYLVFSIFSSIKNLEKK